MSLTGTGIVPTTSPLSATFSSQTVGTTSTAQAIMLINPGSPALSISSIAITGTNSGDFAQMNNCGASRGSGGDALEPKWHGLDHYEHRLHRDQSRRLWADQQLPRQPLNPGRQRDLHHQCDLYPGRYRHTRGHSDRYRQRQQQPPDVERVRRRSCAHSHPVADEPEFQ
ncbi:MAG: hypothetical protein DMG22_09710 [Acidobacteria bacterium]|nr:MAG: hypothetical protein DMG22_09710 [Acidobacteriota bacterium]